MLEIYERQHRRVYRIAFLYLKNAYDAEDVVSTVFVKYLEKPCQFNSLEHEKAWFIQVTKNHCKNYRMSFWKRNIDLGEIPEQAGPGISDEDQEDLWRELFKLPVKYRELLYLYYYEGYSVREIASYSGVKESTLQTRLDAARKRLKKIMESEGYNGR